MLRLEDVEASYGSIRALHSVSLEVGEGEVVALIGANGAGKTTTLKTIIGLLKPRSGRVTFNGERIDGRAVEDIVGRGISLVPEGRRIFPGLTVFENLQVASAQRTSGNGFAEDLERVYALFPKLKERSTQMGWSMSGGEQQMLAIGRALMRRPTLLLLDEPSLGLAPVIIREVFATIATINRLRTSILLVEQNAFKALQVAQRAYVLENGAITLAGPAAELAANPLVKAAYLGG